MVTGPHAGCTFSGKTPSKTGDTQSLKNVICCSETTQKSVAYDNVQVDKNVRDSEEERNKATDQAEALPVPANGLRPGNVGHQHVDITTEDTDKLPVRSSLTGTPKRPVITKSKGGTNQPNKTMGRRPETKIKFSEELANFELGRKPPIPLLG